MAPNKQKEMMVYFNHSFFFSFPQCLFIHFKYNSTFPPIPLGPNDAPLIAKVGERTLICMKRSMSGIIFQ